jgi:predicted nucleic-acid-binding Zn-ribbon protein
MLDGICPKCGSREILAALRIIDSRGHPPHVEIVEPDPPNRPFIWSPQTARSNFQAYVCGACGYTEFYADNFRALNEGRRKGFRSS